MLQRVVLSRDFCICFFFLLCTANVFKHDFGVLQIAPGSINQLYIKGLIFYSCVEGL